MNIGSLELIIGPMYAGKSTELIKRIKMYQILEKNVLVINHKINNRYGTNGISTHDKTKCENSINIEKLQELENNHNDLFMKSEIIIIEELQFFYDGFQKITEWLDKYNKKIIAAGLVSDYAKKPFGDVLSLIPHAEEVIKINALCKKCKDGTKACFTKRTINNDNKVIVGSDECYEAVCRKHYLE